MKKEKRETKKPREQKEEKTISVAYPEIINRKGYRLVFLKPDDDENMNALKNTGNIFGIITSMHETAGDRADEVVVAIK